VAPGTDGAMELRHDGIMSDRNGTPPPSGIGTPPPGDGEERPAVAHALTDEAAEDVQLAALQAELRELASGLPEKIDADPSSVDHGLAKLVLTLIDVIRKVLEHQAVRRMDGGALTEEQIERLGLALLRLDERMLELREVFGLDAEDLEIDLGPLGRLR